MSPSFRKFFVFLAAMSSTTVFAKGDSFYLDTNAFFGIYDARPDDTGLADRGSDSHCSNFPGRMICTVGGGASLLFRFKEFNALVGIGADIAFDFSATSGGQNTTLTDLTIGWKGIYYLDQPDKGWYGQLGAGRGQIDDSATGRRYIGIAYESALGYAFGRYRLGLFYRGARLGGRSWSSFRVQTGFLL